jgi:hypothetical protein
MSICLESAWVDKNIFKLLVTWLVNLKFIQKLSLLNAIGRSLVRATARPCFACCLYGIKAQPLPRERERAFVLIYSWQTKDIVGKSWVVSIRQTKTWRLLNSNRIKLEEFWI